MSAALSPAETWWRQRKNSWIEASRLTLPIDLLSLITEYYHFVPTLQKVQAVFNQWTIPQLQWLFDEVLRIPTHNPVSSFFDLPPIPPLSPNSLPAVSRAQMGNIPFPGDMIDVAGQSHPVMRWEDGDKQVVVAHLFRAATPLHHTHLCHLYEVEGGRITWTETSEFRIFSTANKMMLWFQKMRFMPSSSRTDLWFESFLCPKNKYQLIDAGTNRRVVPLSSELLHLSNTTGVTRNHEPYTESQQQNECVCDVPVQLMDRLIFTEPPPNKRKAELVEEK